MDLRSVLTTEAQREEAARLLDYQPFIISDDIQTGAAYSWVAGSDARVTPPLLFRREQLDEATWNRAAEANGRLRRMYDDFIAEIVARYPNGSLLDLACNNGYFPVRANMLGMRPAVGSDANRGQARAVSFLNYRLGTRADFKARHYDSGRRRALGYLPFGYLRGRHTGLVPGLPRCDVVSLVAIVCHLADPLGFLAYAGRHAKEAIFFMGQVLDSEYFLVSYQKPHESLGAAAAFPFAFNDNTRVSRGLLWHAFEQMGFSDIVELPWQADWLPQRFGESPSVNGGNPLAHDLRHGSRHIAMLAMRG